MSGWLTSYNPDILDCLANLSNDEVKTPPSMANAMLDMLESAWAAEFDGESIWRNPDVTFLDPFTKSGVFLREVTRRLTQGLASAIPDRAERVDHILTRQVFGIGITSLSALMARRSVYCSKTANGPHSIARSFATESGNIWFERTEHEWIDGGRKFDDDSPVEARGSTRERRRCRFCGANEKDYARSADLESHAYAFIHTDDIHGRLAEIFGETMHFDVIIGNPPYQLSDGGGGGGVSATPIYNKFVETALSLEPRFATMITPSRWFSGGKGLDDFRNRMLRDSRFRELVDFPQLYDVFPGVKIRGGVSYWLWDKSYSGDCRITTVVGGKIQGVPTTRALDDYDILVRRSEAIPILEKVTKFQVGGRGEPRLSDQVSARRPFGLTNDVGVPVAARGTANVKVYANQRTGFVSRALIKTNVELIDRWKVFLVKAHGTSGREDRVILGNPLVVGPGSVCTETYLVMGSYESEINARYLADYLKTRFVRFLVSLRKITQNITRDTYAFVPLPPLDQQWTDEMLYARYGLNAEEIAFIESQVAPHDDAPDDEPLDEDSDD